MADRAFAIKLLNDLCLECSICAIFFNSSFTVSINARFRNRILSSTLINEFLMLFFTLVSNCIPFKNRFSNKAWPIYPLSAQSFPLYLSGSSLVLTVPCLHVRRGEHEIQDLSLVVDYQVQLEPEEPSHGTFSTSGQAFKGFMNQYSLVTANSKRGRIHETDAGTCP